MLFRLVLGKEKLKTLVTSSELYLVFDQFTQYKGQKKPYLLLLWTVVGGRVGNQAWQEFCCVWCSWCATSVLGSWVFGQASMKSCDDNRDNLALSKKIYPIVVWSKQTKPLFTLIYFYCGPWLEVE